MPTIQHNGATIYYEEYGSGFPILTFAPAGVQSTIEVWRKPMAPINPMTEWAANYRVIVMDQRNAGGQSHAPLTPKDGWDSYTSDHIAVLDHLKIDKAFIVGGCMGVSVALAIGRLAPKRVRGLLLHWPVGGYR